MLRIFLPLYLMLFCISFFSEFLFQQLLLNMAPEAVVDDIIGDVSGGFYMAETILNNTPEEQWPDELKRMSSVNIPIQVVTPDELGLNEEERRSVQQGEILVFNLEDNVVIKAFGDQGQLIQMGPVETTDLFDTYFYWILLGYTAGLIGCVVLWSFTVQRRIRHLRAATQQFGNGDLSVRASESGSLRVSDLNHNFNTMAERIEQLIESHKHLSSAVSHELRTPIARIKFELDYAQGLEEASGLHASLNSIAEDVTELELLVAEALTYARFERSDLQLDYVEEDLSDWLKNWSEQIRLERPEVALTVAATEHVCMVPFHPASIKRALDNLVLNASRYAHHKVDVSLLEQDNEVCILVDDDGEGIPEEQWQTLFDPFVRADKSRSKETGGFGLGLAIVQQIMLRHHGKAEVMHSPLGGARFKLRWPKQQS